MSKTKFSKSELLNIKNVLIKENMLPCDKICIYYDTFNSSYKISYSVIKFVKDKKQLDMGLVTRTVPKTILLENQLKEYFGGKYGN